MPTHDDYLAKHLGMVRDTCLCLHLQRAARVVARLFDDALLPLNVTNGQFSLLMSLNQLEPPTIGDTAKLLGMDRTTVTAALKSLQRRGLVKVSASAADRRVRTIRLTATGRRLLLKAMPIWTATHAKAEGMLSLPANGLRSELRTIADATYL